MRYLILGIAFSMSINAGAQDLPYPCPKDMNLNKYVEIIGQTDVTSFPLLYNMKLKGKDGKTNRYLLTSYELAIVLHININDLSDTTLISIIKKATLGEDLAVTFDSRIIGNNHLISERLYDSISKKSVRSVYNKFFNSKGILRGNSLWGLSHLVPEYAAAYSYLIDNYAVIYSPYEHPAFAEYKPCFCKRSK